CRLTYHSRMATLHDRSERAEILQRLQSLRPDSRGRWGKMSVDQMLWHLAQAMEIALGRGTITRVGPPLPKAMVKFMVLRLPWFKGAPTHPDFVAQAKYDFAEQQARCLELVDAIATKPVEGV